MFIHKAVVFAIFVRFSNIQIFKYTNSWLIKLKCLNKDFKILKYLYIIKNTECTNVFVLLVSFGERGIQTRNNFHLHTHIYKSACTH